LRAFVSVFLVAKKCQLYVHVIHAIHHDLTMLLPSKKLPAASGKVGDPRIKPNKRGRNNHNSPQLTTNAKVRSFPQLSGLSSAIDFRLFQETPKRECRNFKQ
jgi:hypothetical protein